MKRSQFKRVAGLIFLGMLILISGKSVSAFSDVGCSQMFERMGNSLKDRHLQWIETHLTANEPWQFNPVQERLFQAIYEDPQLSVSQKNRKLFDALLAERLKNSNPLSRAFMYFVTRDTLVQKSIYSQTLGRLALRFSGPHYNPIFNRVVSRLFGDDDIRDLIFGIHELQHAYDRNHRPYWTYFFLTVRMYDLFSLWVRSRLSPLVTYQMESPALGAQWELVSRIPANIRDRLRNSLRVVYLEALFQELELNPTSGKRGALRLRDQVIRKLKEQKKTVALELVNRFQLKEFESAAELMIYISSENEKSPLRHSLQWHSLLTRTALASLEYADLSREEFLKKIAPMHGYNAQYLWNYFDKPTQVRPALMMMMTTQMIQLFRDWGELDYQKYQDFVERIPAYDVYWAFVLINSLFFDEDQFLKTKEEINLQVDAILKLIKDGVTFDQLNWPGDDSIF